MRLPGRSLASVRESARCRSSRVSCSGVDSLSTSIVMPVRELAALGHEEGGGSRPQVRKPRSFAQPKTRTWRLSGRRLDAPAGLVAEQQHAVLDPLARDAASELAIERILEAAHEVRMDCRRVQARC